jgi:hypothetical protein
MESEDMLEKTVRIEWEDDLTIQHLEPQGAVSFVGGGHRYVLVKPQAQYVGHDYFSVKGIRRAGPPEDLLEPTITCTGDVNVPPPSPPGPPECDLAPQVHTYPIGSTVAAGSRVTMKLSSWKPWRVFTLTYFGQASLMVKKTEGATLMVLPHRSGAEQMTFSFTLNDQPSSGEGCEGHPSCLEFEAHPGVLHHPHVVCISKSPPSPPRLPPVLLPCPPVAVHPPPSPATIFASASGCYLGGWAKAMPSHSDDPSKMGVRVLVTFDRWVAATVFTVLVKGRGLASTNAWSADEVQTSGAPLGADLAFAFKLREIPPADTAAFAFHLEGQSFDRLVQLTCQEPQVEQTPVPKAITTPAYTYDTNSLYDNVDSYGIQTNQGDSNQAPAPQLQKPTDTVSETSGVTGATVGLFGAVVFLLAGGLILWRRSTNKSLSIDVAVQKMIHGPRRARATPSERAEFTAEDDVLTSSIDELNPAAAAAAAALADESPQAMAEVELRPNSARRPAV